MLFLLLLVFGQGKNGHLTQMFQRPELHSQLLFGYRRAVQNNWQQPAQLEEYCDGQRFLELRDVLQVFFLAKRVSVPQCARARLNSL